MEGTYNRNRWDEAEIRCADRESKEYPEKIKEYPNMPEKLYFRGMLPNPQLPTVAVVGARMCSPYGRIQAFKYAKSLSECGVQIISGMALGIDSEGHKGALEGGTPTFAVLGSGVDVCYPAANRSLYRRIQESGGGILSEYLPGSPPKQYCFPARNRIISALSDVVLVVEAKVNSGSLITAGFALEMGKAVFAVPGAVNEALSLGCHKLIYDGAGIAYSPEVILSELGLSGRPETNSGQKNKLGLARDLNMVYSCFDLRPESLDDIIRKTGLSSGKVSNYLIELELLGLIRQTGRHYYERTP